jgi:isorenieratene synthase
MFALRSPTFRMRDLVRMNARAAAPLAAVSVPQIYDQLDDRGADVFLREINFPEAARHLAFEVFSRSFFARPEELSAAELATMFHIYFLGSSEGLVFDVATSNFDVALWTPLRKHLQCLGVRFHTGSSVTGLGSRPTVILADGEQIPTDGVVLATDVDGLRRVVAQTPGLGDQAWRDRVAGMGTAPPFVVYRVWLDRPVDADRPAFLGSGGRPPIENVSVLERYEAEAAEWAGRTGGSVVELHAYAATEPQDTLPGLLLERLHEIFPETAAATIIDERVLYRDDCPSFTPGAFASRPGVHTPHPWLALAGDGIRIDLPVALMERAATTGFTAANALLTHFGIAGHCLDTVPTEGRSALLRRLAARTGPVPA